MNKKKVYNRGCLMPLDKITAAGALQMVVSAVSGKVVMTRYGEKSLLEINAWGVYAGPSGIPYALGKDILGSNGMARITATAWDKIAGFTEQQALAPGDVIMVYAKDWHVTDYKGRKKIVCTVSKVEVDKRAGVPSVTTTAYETVEISSGQAVMDSAPVETVEEAAAPEDVEELEHLYTYSGLPFYETLADLGWQMGSKITSSLLAAAKEKLLENDEPIAW